MNALETIHETIKDDPDFGWAYGKHPKAYVGLVVGMGVFQIADGNHIFYNGEWWEYEDVDGDCVLVKMESDDFVPEHETVLYGVPMY